MVQQLSAISIESINYKHTSTVLIGLAFLAGPWLVSVAYHNDRSCNMTCLLIDYESRDWKLVQKVSTDSEL